MKLGEALSQRANEQKVFEQLKARAQAVASYQEGEKPAEDARELIAKAEKSLAKFEELVKKINKTNTVSRLENGMSLTDALAQRDTLRLTYSLLSVVADAATVQRVGIRQMRSELRMVAAVKVSEVRENANAAARRHRELDAKIQEANWTIDLVEE